MTVKEFIRLVPFGTRIKIHTKYCYNAIEPDENYTEEYKENLYIVGITTKPIFSANLEIEIVGAIDKKELHIITENFVV